MQGKKRSGLTPDRFFYGNPAWAKVHTPLSGRSVRSMLLTNAFIRYPEEELFTAPKEEMPMGGYMVRPIEPISENMGYPYSRFLSEAQSAD